MQKGKVIAIVGAPRSGKSFLCKQLSKKYKCIYRLEVKDDKFPDFIKDSIQNNTDNFRRQAWFRNTQIENILSAKKSSKNKIVLVDTFWADNFMYLDILLSSHDLEVAKKQFSIDVKTLPWPDKIVFLKNSKDRTKKFIIEGGREFDKSEDYFENIISRMMSKYSKLLKIIPKELPVLKINRSKLDFKKEQDLKKVWDFINK